MIKNSQNKDKSILGQIDIKTSQY